MVSVALTNEWSWDYGRLNHNRKLGGYEVVLVESDGFFSFMMSDCG